MCRINASKTDVSRDRGTVYGLVIIWATVGLQDFGNVKPRTCIVAVGVMTIRNAGQRPGALSVVGYDTGQWAQYTERRVSGGLHRVRATIAWRVGPIAVTGAIVITVGRAGLRSHLACKSDGGQRWARLRTPRRRRRHATRRESFSALGRSYIMSGPGGISLHGRPSHLTLIAEKNPTCDLREPLKKKLSRQLLQNARGTQRKHSSR